MTFYYLSVSPFPWKAGLSLERKEIPYILKILSADESDLKRPRFLALNPRGKAPTMVDHGFVLSESSATVECLEEQYPLTGSRLWPEDAKARRSTQNRL